MLVTITRIVLGAFCFIGFLIQCGELFVKFIEGTTTTMTSNVEHIEGQLQFPRFSICLDPPTSISRLSNLGLSPQSWQIDNSRGNNPVGWPITSQSQSDLFDLSMYSFPEIFDVVQIHSPECDINNGCKNKTLRWKEMNTESTGKCFTFLADEISAKENSYIKIILQPVFDDRNGLFRAFIHDLGMELSLINQFWLGTNHLIIDVPLGSNTDISLDKHIYKKLSKPKKHLASCQQNSTTLDFYTCLDKLMERIREPFWCRSPFDFALNQSALVKHKPICTSFNDTKDLFLHQSLLFTNNTYSKNCVKSCQTVSYRPSVTSNKVFGQNHSAIFIYYSTLTTVFEEEVLVYDVIDIISAVGGSLGLFLGFSVLQVGLSLIDRVYKRVQNYEGP